MTRILIVDDDAMVLNATARGFRIAGYEITKASDPREALKLFQAGERFAVVVSDLEMPYMHGDELCLEIQKVAPTAVILQSGNSDVTKRAIACGASFGFVKPVDPSTLREAVAELIAHRAQA